MADETDKPNIKGLEFKPDKLAGAIENLKRNIDQTLELTRLTARIRRESFNALKKQGFTDEQAIELCKKPLISQ